MKTFEGKILFLDRSNINTDEIIPAKHLNELNKSALQPHLFEDLKLDGFDYSKDIARKNVIVSRSNFGCGSSREHAPWSIEQNGINVVIAESFARIFRQNMYNCGMLAIELDKKIIDDLFTKYSNQESTYLTVSIDNDLIKIQSNCITEEIKFKIGPFDKALANVGGWINYADKNY